MSQYKYVKYIYIYIYIYIYNVLYTKCYNTDAMNVDRKGTNKKIILIWSHSMRVSWSSYELKANLSIYKIFYLSFTYEKVKIPAFFS